jgi:TonB family protein
LAIKTRTRSRLFVLACLALCVASAFADGVHRTVVTRTPPVYPELARRMHVGGKVMILATVEANGTVSATKVESGHPLLAAAAEDAVRHWRFSPTTDASESEVEVNFTIGQ